MPFSTFFYYLRIVSAFLGTIFREFWWLLALIIFGKIFIGLNRKYKEKKKKEKEEIKDWVVLQVKINREILQTPKAMEQVFNALHVIEKGYICLELVGMDRGLCFIVRTPKEYKNLVISQFYAQYPEVEIKEIDDYFLRLPAHLPNKDFDLWGTEIALEKKIIILSKSILILRNQKKRKGLTQYQVLQKALISFKDQNCLFWKFLSNLFLIKKKRNL